jgi:hypothetical protein
MCKDELVLILTAEWVLGELGEVVATATGQRALSAS